MLRPDTRAVGHFVDVERYDLSCSGKWRLLQFSYTISTVLISQSIFRPNQIFRALNLGIATAVDISYRCAYYCLIRSWGFPKRGNRGGCYTFDIKRKISIR